MSRGPLTPAATTGASGDVADRLHSAAIHLLRRVRREDDASGLPAPQLSALSVVVFNGPVTLGTLARAEQVRPPTITRVVAALEEQGLVVRETTAADRRVTLIKATPRGTRLLQEGRQRRVAALATTLDRLSAADLRLLRRALTVIEQVARGEPTDP
jgi:DNA-binding MarR family transcriptional regulator